MSRSREQNSLFAEISEGILSQEYAARLRRLETGLGFLGFFTIFSVVATIAAEIGGQDAVTEALISVAMVAVTYSVFRTWQKVGRLAAKDAADRQARSERERRR